MPIYTLQDEKTGRILEVEGKEPPSPEVIADLFERYGTEVKPVRKQIYSPEQAARIARSGLEAGMPDAAIQQFLGKAKADYEAYPQPAPPELKAVTLPPTLSPTEIQAAEAGAPFVGMFRESSEQQAQRAAADRMRAMQETMALERMMPQVAQQATGGDLGTARPSQQMLTADEAQQLQKEMARQAQEKYGVPEWVTEAATAGGPVADIGISTGLPLAVSMVTRNPMAGGAFGSAVANPIVQFRQMLRGERPRFSPTEFVTDVALGAYTPKGLKETEEAINLFRSGMGKLPSGARMVEDIGPLVKLSEGVVTRAGQGAVLGLGGETARQTLEEPSVDVRQILNVGALSTLFGATFGGLEKTAPAVWAKISGKRPAEAAQILRNEPQSPDISQAIKELEEMAMRGERAGAPSAVAPEAGVPVTPLTPSEEVEQAVRRVTRPEPVAGMQPGAPGRPVEVPEMPGAPRLPTEESVTAQKQMVEQMSVEEKARIAEQTNIDEYRRIVAKAGAEEFDPDLGYTYPSEATPQPVREINYAAIRQARKLADNAETVGQQLDQNLLGRNDAMSARPLDPTGENTATFNARVQRVIEGIWADGGKITRPEAAALVRITDPQEYTRQRQQILNQTRPAPAEPVTPGVTKLKSFEQLTPEMAGVKPEEPITPKKSGVLPGRTPILEGAEPTPAGLGEPPLPISPRMLELERPIFDSGQVDEFGNKIWVDNQNRAVDPQTYNAVRDRSRYGFAVPELITSATGTAGGFVYGWNTGEGLPPEERLQRAITFGASFGAGGLFSPVAIRKIISLQGWANGVLRERGPGSGALNTGDPQIVAALAVKGAAVVGEGVKNFADWSRVMVGKFGDEIRPKLKEIWSAGEQAKLIPVGAITDAPAPKVVGDKLPSNTAGVLLYSDYPKSPVKLTNSEVAEKVQEAAITANNGRITSENITPAQEAKIVNNGVDEVVAGLKTANHAGEWYTTQVDDGNTILGVMFPVIRDDALAKASGRFNTSREARVAAAVAQAATSQNLTVPENGKYTVEQFEALLKNGRFDAGIAKKYGTKGRSIASNLELANKMVDAAGWGGLDDFIRKDFTVRELKKAVQDATGRKVNITGKMDDVVQGAAIFGPKIGQGFLQNLLGRFDPVTIDLWMRRTWGRWTGDVLAEGILPEQLGRYVKSLRDEGIELPESLRGMRVTPKGKSKLMIPESFNEKLATNEEFKRGIYDHALKVFERWDKDIYPYIKGNMTPKQKEDVLSGKITINALADQLRKSDARIEAAWNSLPEVGIARAKGKGSKAKFIEDMEKSTGRTADLSNEEISNLKPEWAKSSTVIVNVFEPIDIPSNRDREVITRVVNSIRKKLADRGIRMTNADIQATLWYPEKDIWAKLAGEAESGLKQSYDTVFLKLAEERGLGEQAREAVATARTARAGRGVEPGRTEAVREPAVVPEAAAAGPAYTPKPEDVAKANATSRSVGAVGSAAVTPKYVESTSSKAETILDFGAGKDAAHAKRLRDAGYNVTAYDFGSNLKEGLHDPQALSRKYDTVYASNVLNVQSGPEMLRNTLEQIKSVTSGRAVFNYPDSPRYTKMTPVQVASAIKEVFGVEPKLVGGRPSTPIWEVRLGSAKGTSTLDPKIAGFVAKELALPLAGFAGGFTYGMIEGRDKSPEQRLTNALLMGAAGGALSPLVLGKAIKSINSMPPKPPPATQAVIGQNVPTRTLDDVRNIFREKPDTPSFAEKIRKLPANAITTLQNKYYALAELQKSILGYLPKLNLADRFSLIAGAVGKAEADLIDLSKVRESLIPDISADDLNTYMFLRRAFDRLTTEQNNPQLGSRAVSDYTIPEVQFHLGTLRNELGTDKMMRLEKFAEELQKSADADLQLMVSTGRMSQAQYNEIKALNDFYAPFYVMEYISQREGSTLPGIGGAIDTTQPLTQSIKGISDKDFKLGDMMTAFGANKLRAYVLAEKNLAMQDLAKLTVSDPKGNFIKDLGLAAAGLNAPKGWEIVSYMKNGAVNHLAVSPDVSKAVKNMDYQQLNLLNRIMAATANPLRAGATGLNLAFQVVNQFKDLGRLGLVSKYGLRSISDLVMFPLDVASAAASSWKSNVFGSPDELMMEYLRSGASRSTIASQLSPDTFTRFAQQKDQSGAAKLLGVPVRTFIDTTSKIGNAIEETAKLAGFKRGLRIENLDKLSPAAREEAIQRIAYEVRNYAGSPDFSKHGTIGRELNVLFMFLNARIQGTAADLRRLTGGTGTREGWEAALKLAGGVGTLTTYVWYNNHQPDNVEDYNSRPLTERNNYFLIPRYNKAGQPMYYINEDGEKVREYWRFPKAEVIGQVANITEGALNFFANKDPKAALNAGTAVLESLSPVSISGRNLDERFESILSGLNPILKAPIEYSTNRNLFGHRDIVPRGRLQQASPEEQYKETTPPAFITAAQAMPEFMPAKMRSPLHLQQLVSNFTGGLLTQFMRPELEGRDPLSSNPVLGRFFSAPYLDKEEDWNEIKKYQTMQADKSLTRDRAIDSFIKNSDRMPIPDRMEALRQIIIADPEKNTRALLDNLKDKNAGTTEMDRSVRNLTPNLRAQYLEGRRSKLPDQQSQAQFYMQMYQRGILTPETVAEIAKLRKLEAEAAGKKP